VTGNIQTLRNRQQGGKAHSVSVLETVAQLLDHESVHFHMDFRDSANLRQVELLSKLRSHVSGIAVNGLLPAEDLGPGKDPSWKSRLQSPLKWPEYLLRQTRDRSAGCFVGARGDGSRSASSLWEGPMVRTEIFPPSFCFKSRAASRAMWSSGLMMLSTPSLIMVIRSRSIRILGYQALVLCTRHVSFVHQTARDNDTLHLRSPLVNLTDLGIPVITFDGIGLE